MASAKNDETLSPILDTDRLEIIRSLDDNKGVFLAELVELYRVSTPPVLSRLLTAIRSQQATDSILLAHKIKSMGANLGTSRLVALLELIETNSASLNTTDLEDLAIRLVHEYELSLAALLSAGIQKGSLASPT